MPLPTDIDYKQLIEDSNLFKVDNPAQYYNIVKQIGTGGYGKIYLVSKKDDESYYALKFINENMAQMSKQESVRNEIALMATCSHENIVKYHDGYFFKDRFWIFLEYMDAGCLTDMLETGLY